MNDQQAGHFRTLIETRLSELDEGDTRGAEAQKTVDLDQQAIGRLSRMDALQNQAMARAGQARRATERRRLRAALERLDEGEYGFCDACGDEIATGRLELDPAATRCVDCARG